MSSGLERLIAFVLSPIAISIYLCVIIVLLLPPIFEKYRADIVESGYLSTESEEQYYWEDLDKDGTSEKIISYKNSFQNHSIQVFDNKGGIYDQWNFPGGLLQRGHRLCVANIDNDSYKEIYVFSEDSCYLVLSCIEPLDTNNSIEFIAKKICLLCNEWGPPDCGITDFFQEDLTGDGRGDLCFTVNSGYSKQPRQIFIYDPFNDTFIFSAPSGSSYAKISLHDLDDDGQMEILCNINACGNVPQNLGIPYSDYSAWLKLYDSKLRLLFPPIEFPGFRSSIQSIPMKRNDTTYILVLFNHTGPQDLAPKLMLYNTEGKLIQERQIENASKNNRALIAADNGFYIFTATESLSVFNNNLCPIQKTQLIIGREVIPKLMDLDKDGDEEFLFIKPDKHELIIYRDNFNTKEALTISAGAEGNPMVIKELLRDGKPYIFFRYGNQYSILSYSRSPLYHMKYPVYLIIGLSVFGFISLIQWHYAYRMRKKENIRKQISSLQLQNIKRQMDPHFAFNVFNSIGATIRKSEKETAYQAFVKMSILLRNVFDDSGALFRSLGEELKNIQIFVELEQLRFKNKFDFIIKQSDTVDLQWMVPAMIFQNYVENAVKHGLLPLLDKKGILQLELTTDESFLLIFIRDNGPGKTIHYKSPYSTGNGLQLMEKYFALLDDFCNLKIVNESRVLKDEKQIPCGTEVRLKLPLSFMKKQKSNG